MFLFLRPVVLFLLVDQVRSSPFYPPSPSPLSQTCNSDVKHESQRQDCGYIGIEQAECVTKGCCWTPASAQTANSNSNVPWCYYSEEGVPAHYIVSSYEEDAKTGGIKARLSYSTFLSNPVYASPVITDLVLQISFENENRLHVKFTDANDETRYEVPEAIFPRPISSSSSSSLRKTKHKESNFEIEIPNTPGSVFSLVIRRISDQEVLFDSRNIPLVYQDQYISFGSHIPPTNKLFGLGESSRDKLAISKGEIRTLWNADDPSAGFDYNVYGSHPFVLQTSGDASSASGFFLLNSNGMDVIYQANDQLVFNVLGGVIDLYFFAGSSVKDVIKQYQQVIGLPAMMPFWSLGFHNCRYGISDVTELEAIYHNYTDANIPLDTMWADIDYMQYYQDFSFSQKNFPAEEMKSFTDTLHQSGHRIILITDPGIPLHPGYQPYDQGMEMDIFIKDVNGDPYLGQVWPGPVFYPDFFHPEAETFWFNQYKSLYNQVPVDGSWIDMNEVSNFCNLDGKATSCKNTDPTCGVVTDTQDATTECCLTCSNDLSLDNLNYDFPPYQIKNGGQDRMSNALPLAYKTMSMNNKYSNGELEYNMHNLYGFSESQITHKVYKKLTGERPFVLTRSSFAGSGRWVAHWTGDNSADWRNLAGSIVTMLSMSFFGLPMVGADICGFIGNTTDELCARWIGIGAFYPFSRDHSTLDSTPHEMYRSVKVADAAKFALAIRYKILPYLNTALYQAHTEGEMVARPLFANFPGDSNTIDIEHQFMLGDGLLISGIVEEGKTSLDAYFPRGVWYAISANSPDINNSKGDNGKQSLATPLGQVHVHLLSGIILPMQGHNENVMTTEELKKTALTIYAPLSSSTGKAHGSLFYDNGVQPDIRDYLNMEFDATETTFTSTIINDTWEDAQALMLDEIVIFGLTTCPTNSVTVNGDFWSYYYCDPSSLQLTINNMGLPVSKALSISWK